MKPKDPKNPSGPVMVGDLKVRVYRDLCIGSGTCHAIASKAYNLDDESKSIIIDTADQESENAIIEAAKGCPVAAIIIERANGTKVYPA